MKPALIALAAGAFAIGTTEFGRLGSTRRRETIFCTVYARRNEKRELVRTEGMAMMLSVENSPMGDAAISFYSAAFVSADELLKPNSVAVTTMIPSPILPDTSR